MFKKEETDDSAENGAQNHFGDEMENIPESTGRIVDDINYFPIDINMIGLTSGKSMEENDGLL